MIGSILSVASYAAACNLPYPSLAKFIPAATFSVLVFTVKTGMASYMGFLLAFVPAAMALQLYTGKYSGTPNSLTPEQIQAAAAQGLDPMVVYANERAPPMVVEYLYFPALGAVGTLALTSAAEATGLVSLAAIAPSSLAVWAIIAAHTARCIAFAAERMIYPAPIVAQFLITEKELKTYRAPIEKQIKRIPVRKTLGNNASALLGEVEYAVIQQPALGRNLATGAPVLPKQWVMYVGGNGEVFEASYPSPAEIAKSLNANLLVFNPRGVARSTGNIFSSADLILDAKTVVRQVVKEFNLRPDGRDILLLGHSIGGGIVSELAASELPEASVVLDRTFSSLLDAAIALSPIRNEFLVKTFLPYIFGDFDNVANYKKIKHDRKLVIFHRQDQIIHFKGVSMGRLGAGGLGGDSFVLELAGNTQDNHNCGFDRFANFEEVIKRITKIV